MNTSNFKDIRDKRLKITGGLFACILALLHLLHPTHGISKLILIFLSDIELIVSTPRPLAFFLSAIAIIIGINLVWFGYQEKPIYILGIILMLVYIVGYFSWHLSGHDGFLPGREPLLHGQSVGSLTGEIIRDSSRIGEIIEKE